MDFLRKNMQPLEGKGVKEINSSKITEAAHTICHIDCSYCL